MQTHRTGRSQSHFKTSTFLNICIKETNRFMIKTKANEFIKTNLYGHLSNLLEKRVGKTDNFLHLQEQKICLFQIFKHIYV